MRVPVDWPRPGSETIELSVVRRPATDRNHRIGSMLLNNGAGGSAIRQLQLGLGAGLGDSKMAKHFDLVAVDPRGVGQSTPVNCGNRPLRSPGVTIFPKNEAQFSALVKNNKALAAARSTKSQALLANLDITGVAKDMEAVRIGLGERQVHWYGIQYSALVGKAYAPMYPGRLRSGWPLPAKPVTTEPVRQRPPTLIVQSTHQSYAACSWAFALSSQLPGSRVLSREGDDYSLYFVSPCVIDARPLLD